MSQDQALQLMTQLFWTSFLVAAPLLVATLVVGLIVGVFQVVTQLQEMSLSYVPKLVVAFFVFFRRRAAERLGVAKSRLR